MRKSKAVPLSVLAAAALLAATGCDDHRSEVRNCVDAQNHIVPDSRCGQSPPSGGSAGGYHYIYDGASGGNIGDTVEGGSGEPEAGARIVSGETGAVVRGGFGGGDGDGGHGAGE
jgi:hypothetical protein